MNTSYILYRGYNIMEQQPVNNILPVTTRQNLPFILFLPLAGDRPCLDFINTIDWRLRPDKYRDALENYSDLLAFALRLSLIEVSTFNELSERALHSPEEAARATSEARLFRNALATIIDDIAGRPGQAPRETPQATALAAFNTFRRRAHEHESISWVNGCFALITNPKAEGCDLPWLILVRDAERLLQSPLFSHVKVCAADGCGWVFLDSSKNGTRRWCSMKLCGNRAKTERFRSRKPKS
jgi:predicted RNA-binding Zn ribbon-like protein